MSSVRAVPMRRMEFEPCLDDVPKYFAAGGDIVMSHVFTVLSSVFPDGERFFVRSVEAVLDRIDDPGLRRAAEGFVGQETMHGREHRVLNDHLGELGYPTRAIGAYVRNLNRLRERYQSERANLAVTAALEHYTATLAEMVLTDGEARAEVGHEGVRWLLVWHALEEAEHKAVAFDVYRRVGGTERMRISVMWVMHLMFVLEIVTWTAISLALDAGARRDPRRVLRSLWRLRHTPLVSRQALRRLSRYHRRGFHPNDHDDSEVIAEWRARLFGSEGRLNGLLAGEG